MAVGAASRTGLYLYLYTFTRGRRVDSLDNKGQRQKKVNCGLGSAARFGDGRNGRFPTT